MSHTNSLTPPSFAGASLEDLLRGVARQETAAIEALWVAYGVQIRRVVRSRLYRRGRERLDFESVDVCQSGLKDLLLEVNKERVSKITKLEQVYDFFLGKAANKNEKRFAQKRDCRRETSLIGNDPAADRRKGAVANDPAQLAEVQELLNGLRERLGADDFDLLWKVYVDGWTINEVGAEREMKPATLRQKMRRLREKFRALEGSLHGRGGSR